MHIVDRRAFRRADRVVADTDAHAEFFRDEFGLAADRVEVCFVGAEDRLFRPGLATGNAVSCALRRQADPAARPRDDPRRRRDRTRGSVPGRRQRPARASPRRSARERRVGSLGRVRGSPERDPGRRLRARHLRDDRQGGAGDSQQGLSGDRVRDAAHHRRHARRARAPDRRPRRAARAARRPGCPRGRRAAAGHRPRLRRRASAPRAGRPTRLARARPCSELAGAHCSSGRSQARDPAARASLRSRWARSPPGCRRSRCSNSRRSRPAASTSGT